jgi:hypothetical protein
MGGSFDKDAAEVRAWLVTDEARSPSGAFHAWYDSQSGERAFAYPEITGYALTHLAGLVDASECELAAGVAAGEWLIARISAGNLAARDGWDGDAVYNFDLAMVANGLLTFGDRAGRPDFVDTGLALAGRLADQVQRTGELAALAPGQTSQRSTWSTEGTALMVKATQCLLSAAAVADQSEFRAVALNVARMAARIQSDDGRIATHPSDDFTMCHPHLYAVEGLWIHAEATGDAESRERARAGAEWVWRHQLPSGGLPRRVAAADGAVGTEQFDVTAQAIRAALLVGGVDSDAVLAAAQRLHCVADRVDGVAALPYDTSGSGHRNVWVSLFGRQAMDLLAKRDATGRSELSWAALV